MEARELRIGNLIKSGNGIYKVVAVSVQGVEIMIPYDKDVNSQNGHILNYASTIIKPIPLTEEWLVKLGFNYGGIWIELMGLMSCGRILQHKGIGAKSTAFYINEQFIANIQYLHELQNLYFALTGTELKTK